MKKLPDIDIQLGPLYDILIGAVKTRVLLAGVELDVFSATSSARGATEVAQELGTHPGNTALLLDALTALGLMEKRDGAYRTRNAFAPALSSESPANIGPMLSMMYAMETEPIADLPALVRNGPPREKNIDFGAEEIWAGYARAMANYQRSGMAQKMAAMIAEIPGFASWEKMLDLGGGPGLLCIAMVSRHPRLRGVVFDQPAVAAVAESFIAEYGLQNRIRTMGGDYLNDPIGEGYDLVWASATLNFVRGNLVSFLKKVHRAVAPGGVFVSLAESMRAERTEPASMVLGTLCHGLMRQDFLFDEGEIARAMTEAGFSSVKSIPVETPMMPMVLDIATKASAA